MVQIDGSGDGRMTAHEFGVLADKTADNSCGGFKLVQELDTHIHVQIPLVTRACRWLILPGWHYNLAARSNSSLAYVAASVFGVVPNTTASGVRPVQRFHAHSGKEALLRRRKAAHAANHGEGEAAPAHDQHHQSAEAATATSAAERTKAPQRAPVARRRLLSMVPGTARDDEGMATRTAGIPAASNEFPFVASLHDGWFCMSVCLSVFLSFCLSFFQSFCLSFFQSFCLSVFLSVCLSFSLSFCLSVCLHMYGE
jgi:hypothetical protein